MRRPGLAAFLVVLGASIWINLGSFHRLQNGDSIVPALVSLEAWTPFYWEQGRFGMLVPLIAMPIRHPLANLLFQSIVTCALGLAAFWLVAWIFVPRFWFPVGACASAAFLLLTSAHTRFEYLGTPQPYGTSLGLALLGTAGLLSADPRSLKALASGLMVAAALWVSPTAVLFIAPALLAEAALMGRCPKARVIAALLWLGAGLVASEGLSRASGEPHAPAGPGSWIHTIAAMAGNSWRAYLSEGLGVLMLGALILFLFPLVRTGSAGRLSRVLPILVGAAAAVLGMAVVGRVAEDPSERYALTGIVTSLVAAIAVAGEAARRRFATRRWFLIGPSASLVILAAAVLSTYGLPSMAGVRDDVDRGLGAYTPSLIAARTTHFVGNYWKVWPAVFHFNLTLYERGSSLRLWGITHRSRPTLDSWAKPPEWRLAAPVDETEILWWIRGYGLPFVGPVGVQGNVVLLRFVEGDQAPGGFPVPQRFVPGMPPE